MKRTIIFIGLCATIFQTSCASHEEHHHKESKFLVTNPLRADTSITKDYVCQIHSIQHIELRALERGYLENIYVDEGQFVKKGELLFRIMPRIYEAEQKRAQAEADFAQIEYNTTKSLADSNVVAPNELAMAQAKLNMAKAELAMADVHLSFTEIKAPFDGFIDRFKVRLGSLLEEGELLTSLSDNSEMWVYFNVPEAEYLEYQTEVKTKDDLKVQLMMANNKFFDQTGEISTIEADFNNETGNIAFRATFPNPKGLLRHGETGNVVIRVPLQNTLLIPQKSTFEVLDKKFVYVIDDKGVIHSREITVEAEMPHLFAVSAGLEERDVILLEGLRLVRENQEIDYELVDANEALSHLSLYAE